MLWDKLCSKYCLINVCSLLMKQRERSYQEHDFIYCTEDYKKEIELHSLLLFPLQAMACLHELGPTKQSSKGRYANCWSWGKKIISKFDIPESCYPKTSPVVKGIGCNPDKKNKAVREWSGPEKTLVRWRSGSRYHWKLMCKFLSWKTACHWGGHTGEKLFCDEVIES